MRYSIPWDKCNFMSKMENFFWEKSKIFKKHCFSSLGQKFWSWKIRCFDHKNFSKENPFVWSVTLNQGSWTSQKKNSQIYEKRPTTIPQKMKTKKRSLTTTKMQHLVTKNVVFVCYGSSIEYHNFFLKDLQ